MLEGVAPALCKFRFLAGACARVSIITIMVVMKIVMIALMKSLSNQASTHQLLSNLASTYLECNLNVKRISHAPQYILWKQPSNLARLSNEMNSKSQFS